MKNPRLDTGQGRNHDLTHQRGAYSYEGVALAILSFKLSWPYLSRPILFGRISNPDTTPCATAKFWQAAYPDFVPNNPETSIFRIWISLLYLLSGNCNWLSEPSFRQRYGLFVKRRNRLTQREDSHPDV